MVLCALRSENGWSVTDLEELFGSDEVVRTVILAILVLARVVPLVLFVPFFAGSSSSTSLRVILSFALLAALFPNATSGVGALGLSLGQVGLLFWKEVVVGLSLGVLTAVGFHTLTMAGQLIDQARGVDSTMLDPLGGDARSPLAALHLLLGVVLFLIIGGHRAFLAAVAGSYELVPLVELPLAAAGMQAGALNLARLFGAAFAGALLLAAPAVLALLLSEVIVGFLGRTAPGFATSLSLVPLRAALGLAMAMLTMFLVYRIYLPELIELSRYVEYAAEHLGATP